jgi:hypothetical protein
MPDRRIERGARDRVRLAQSTAPCRARRARRAAGHGPAAAAEGAQDEVVDQRKVRRAADAARSSGTCATPGDRFPPTAARRDLGPITGLARARPQTGDDLGELGLAIAGDGRDADDLAGTDLERRAAERRHAAVVVGADVLDAEHDRALFHGGPCELLEDRAPDHQSGELGARDAVGSIPAAVDAPGAHDRDPVGDREDLAELVADERRRSAGRAIERSVVNSSAISWGARTAVGSSRIRTARRGSAS